MIFSSREIPLPEKPGCEGCLTGHDVGVPFGGIAYAHPECGQHGDSAPAEWREQNYSANEYLEVIRQRERELGAHKHNDYRDAYWRAMTEAGASSGFDSNKNQGYVVHIAKRHHTWLVLTRLKAFREGL